MQDNLQNSSKAVNDESVAGREGGSDSLANASPTDSRADEKVLVNNPKEEAGKTSSDAATNNIEDKINNKERQDSKA